MTQWHSILNTLIQYSILLITKNIYQAFQMMRTNNQVPSAARNGKQAKIRLFHGSPDAGPKQKRNPSKAVKGSLFLNSRAQEG